MAGFSKAEIELIKGLASKAGFSLVTSNEAPKINMSNVAPKVANVTSSNNSVLDQFVQKGILQAITVTVYRTADKDNWTKMTQICKDNKLLIKTQSVVFDIVPDNR